MLACRVLIFLCVVYSLNGISFIRNNVVLMSNKSILAGLNVLRGGGDIADLNIPHSPSICNVNVITHDKLLTIKDDTHIVISQTKADELVSQTNKRLRHTTAGCIG